MLGQRRGGELFLHLKHELDLDDDAEALFSTQQLQSRLAFWIDGYYNRERRHSTIDYLSPINYECPATMKLAGRRQARWPVG